MAMWKFVTKKVSNEAKLLCLPDPETASTKEIGEIMAAANAEILKTVNPSVSSDIVVSKRGVKRKATNNNYTPELRAKIARYATEHGTTSAAKKFSKELNLNIGESSVRLMKNQYIKSVKTTKSEPKTLDHS